MTHQGQKGKKTILNCLLALETHFEYHQLASQSRCLVRRELPVPAVRTFVGRSTVGDISTQRFANAFRVSVFTFLN